MTFLKVSVFAVILFLTTSCVWAQRGYYQFDSDHFRVRYHPQLDVIDIAQKLDVSRSSSVRLRRNTGDTNSPKVILARLLDDLYSEVSDVLDIHMPSYRTTLVICPSRMELSDILRVYLRRSIDVPAFYFHEKNSLYVSYEDLRVGVFAHELAHGIISHYFVVPPSTKVQEVLAGYVEYSIRKKRGSLPR